jgi:hypothetical protein
VNGRDRAVSETIGFVVTFSMIVLMVGLVYTAGTSALGEFQQAEQTDNAEYAMEALAETLGTLERGDPARASELRVGGGSFGVTNGTTLDVSVAGASPYSRSFQVRGLSYRRDETTVAFASGAVIRTDRGNAVMLRDPSFICTPDRAIVSVVTLRNVGNSTRIGTSGSVVVEARTVNRTLMFPVDASTAASDATAVTVTPSGARADGWEQYFSSAPQWTATGSGYTCNASEVYVRRTIISVRLFV